MLRLDSGQENQGLLDAECGRYTRTSVHGSGTLMKENWVLMYNVNLIQEGLVLKDINEHGK